MLSRDLRYELDRLRKQWALVSLFGLFGLAALAAPAPDGLARACGVWVWCSVLLFRGLSENTRMGNLALLPSLGAPTLITMLRGFLIAIAAGFLFVPEIAAPAYSLAAILDHLDGRIARRLDRETRLGSRLDMEIDAAGVLVASLAGIGLGKLPLWYLLVGLARYLFVLGMEWRVRTGRPVRELDPSSPRRFLAGCQMGFLAAAWWPQVPADATQVAAFVFGFATLAMFLRDFVHASRGRSVTFLLWLAAAGLFAACLRSVPLGESLRAIGRLDPHAVGILVSLNLAALVVFSLRWWWILRGMGRRTSLAHLSCYRLAGFGLSYFTPGPQIGGEPLQVLLLERRSGARREIAIASVGLDRLLDAVVNFGFVAAALFFLVHPSTGIALVFASLPLAYLAALARGFRPLSRILPGRELVRASEDEGGRFCRERPLHLALALLSSLLSWGFILVEYWLLARFLGMTLPVQGVVLGLAAARLAYLLFFPAALGVLEVGQIAALGALGFPPELAVSLSLVVRARDVALGGLGLSWGLKAVLAAPRASVSA